MKEIQASFIGQTVARLCQEANFYLGEDVLHALRETIDKEESPLGREVLQQLLANADIAAREKLPLCQDCGMATVFLELGQEVHISGGGLYTVVEDGVRQGYTGGFLRKSIVKNPFSTRVNTKDNTPPVIHTKVVPGDTLKITVAPKGGGSENMSRFTVLTPALGRQGVIDFVVKSVQEAGSNPCPPLIVGVGIGGTAEKTMMLSKEALLRLVGQKSPEPEVAALEIELYRRINTLGIGPQGFGGSTTALAVNVEVFPSHIASLPVAVSLQCHSARHREAVL